MEPVLPVPPVTVSYVVYDSVGYVLRRGSAPTIWDISKIEVLGNESILVANEPLDPTKSYYVKDQQLEECKVIKPWVSKTMVEANGVDTVTISDIPAGSSVSFIGSKSMAAPVVVPETEVTLTFTAPDKVKVYIQNRPEYGQATVEVDAT